jgi:hypothetical protein
MDYATHLFKRRRFARLIITLCISWYVSYKLSYLVCRIAPPSVMPATFGAKPLLSDAYRADVSIPENLIAFLPQQVH